MQIRTAACTISIAWVATLAAWAPPVSAADSSEDCARIRFVYDLSDQPATQLIATVVDPRTAETRRRVLGEDGLPTAAAAGLGLRVSDPETGLILFAANDFRPPPEGEVRLPLPVRVVGRVVGFDADPEAVHVHYGFGPRISVSDYQRSRQGLLLGPFATEERPWGLDLPTISSSWEMRRVESDVFDTGWISIEAPPQLIVADRSGRVATIEVPLPDDVAAHATLQAGEIKPQESAVIEIDRETSPRTDLPLVLQAGIEGDAAASGDGEAAALRLTLLNRLAPRTALFAMRRGALPLELEGVTRIGGLPPFSSLGLYVAGPMPGLIVRHRLRSVEGGVTRVPLDELELLGSPKRVPLTGVVHMADTKEPLPAATVVLSSYPDRVETRTDGAGRFRIPEVATGRAAVLFVDAAAPGPRHFQPPFDRITVSRRIEIAADASSVETLIEVPPLLHGADVVSCPGGQPVLGSPPIQYSFAACGTCYTQDELQLAYCPILGAYVRQAEVLVVAEVKVEGIWVHPQGGSALAQVTVPVPGSYTFVLSYTPFVYAVLFDVPIDSSAQLTFQPPEPTPSAVVSALDGNRRPVPDLEIAFSNWVYSASPYDALTGGLGTTEVFCFNQDPVPAFVRDPRGCFEGPVQLQRTGTNLVIGPCEEEG